jgi:hypothetical protein
VIVGGIACLGLLALASSASAQPTVGTIDKCRAAIYKNVVNYAKQRTLVFQKCNDKRLKGGDYTGLGSAVLPCDSSKVVKAENAMRAKVNGACQDAGVTPAHLAWPLQCPTFEGACGTGFPTDATSDQIVTCLVCLGENTIDQTIDFLYATLAAHPSGSKANKCQRTLGKTVAKFTLAKEKIFAKCRQLKDKGALVPPSADCLAGDAKGLAKLAKEELKKQTKIHKACDAFSGADVGITNCLQVTVPGGPACHGAVVTANDLVSCVDCVAEFKVDCLERATAPHHGSYPSQCAATPGPTPTQPRPTPTFDPIQFYVETNVVKAGRLPFKAY